MSTPQGNRGQRGPNAAKMRAIARDRSRARARIAHRDALQQRALLGAGVLVGLTVLLWILAGATSMPAAIAIASTALGGLYLVGLGALVSSWGKLNDEDEERISRANHALRSRRDAQRKLTERTSGDVVARSEAPVQAAKPKHALEQATPEQTVEAPAVKKDGEGARAENPSVKALKSRPAPRVARVDRIVEGAKVEDRPVREAGSLDVPSYTLKPTIQRRSVKPYVAPEAPEAEVPYRPTRVGERIGDEPIEAANPAPEMTGTEELRSDVLGGGSTLDALLDRRRA